MMRGPCSNPSASRIRREESSNTVRFDPLAGGFAFMSGEHRFFLTPAGQAEQPSGVARFATVWQQRGRTWLMRRVISYAHGPGVPELTAVPLTSEALRRLAGAYAGEQGASAEVRLEGDRLVLTSGGAVFHLVPLAPNRFGVADRPVQFVFEADTLQVMENGSAVAQMRRKAAAP